MKERPIIFNTENVKAILEGRKTQTRRVIKPQPDVGLSPSDSYSHIEVGKYHPTMIGKDGEAYPGDEIFGAYTDDGEWGWKCPYGQVGDRLWVRETFAYESPDGDRYVTVMPNETKILYHATDDWEGVRVPSIFIPRWASRINLEITEIRVERVQEITEEDAKAEGVHLLGYTTSMGRTLGKDTYRYSFEHLWDSLNAKRGYDWESNPWVWVINCKKV